MIARDDPGVAAIKALGDGHAELKSIHTIEEGARGRGIGRALYTGAGFTPCAAFGDYVPSPNSAYMTLDLRP